MIRQPGDGWEEALKIYRAQADDLHAGRVPRVVDSEGLTVKSLCNAFLNAKLLQMQSGDLTAGTFNEYRQATDRIVKQFGKSRMVDDLASDDFERLRAGLAKQYGPVRLGKSVQLVRTAFKYGYEAGLMDRPVRFGPLFKKPSASVLRKHRAKSPKRLYAAAEILKLLEAASLPLKAMILLGVNCGFGNSDVSDLPQLAVDLEKGWIEFPRPKTGIERRCPLWPETVAALQSAITERPKPQSESDKDLVFITTFGNRWVQGATNSVGLEFSKLLRKLSINGRKGLGFYSLRHTFRTVADSTKDFPAIRLIMGHVDSSIDAVYRETIDDSRLIAVTEHVHTWLFEEGVTQ